MVTTSNDIVIQEDTWTELYDASGISPYNPIEIYNIGNYPVRIAVAATTPTSTDVGFPIFTGVDESHLSIPAGNQKVWAYCIDGGARLSVQINSQFANLLTGTPERPGNQRIQVDPDETSFEEGSQWLFSYKFSIPSGDTLLFRFVSAGDYEVLGRTFNVDGGGVEITEYIGGTPTGTFTSITPVRKNRMSIAPTPSPLLSIGYAVNGTITGGTSRTIARLLAASATAQKASVGGTVSSKLGFPAETRYFLFTNIGSGTATGIYDAFWEDR